MYAAPEMGKRQRTSYFQDRLHLIDALPRDLQELIHSLAYGRARLRAIQQTRGGAQRAIAARWTRHRFLRRGYRGYPIVLE